MTWASLLAGLLFPMVALAIPSSAIPGTGRQPSTRPVVAVGAAGSTVSASPQASSAAGYWALSTDGGVFGFGGATFFGSAGPRSLAPVTGLAPTASGGGYWIVALDGGVFSYGDAAFYGSAAGVSTAPVVGLAPAVSGHGYWIVAQDGGVFTYGNAAFFGSAVGLSKAPIVGMARTPSGRGYWLVSLDGGVFSFGDATFYGSAARTSAAPVVGFAPTPTGRGYWLVASDGGVFTYGDARFFGSAAGVSRTTIGGLLPTPTGQGYWIVARNGDLFSFGDAALSGSPVGMSSAPFVGLARPGGPPSMGGLLVADGAPGLPVVALTFDDGPDPSHTLGILDILDRYEVPATFFLIGSHAAGHTDVVREEARRGFSVQNHTWSHLNLTTLGRAGFAAQVDPTQNLIEGLTGLRPRCLRPPYDAHNATTDRLAANEGLHTALWNVDPRDWTGIPASEIIRRILAQLKPVSVVELHDRSAVIDALPQLITQLRARGYHFATICQTGGTLPGSSL